MVEGLDRGRGEDLQRSLSPELEGKGETKPLPTPSAQSAENPSLIDRSIKTPFDDPILEKTKEPGGNFYLSLTPRTVTGRDADGNNDVGRFNPFLQLNQWPTIGAYNREGYEQGEHLLAVMAGSKSNPEILARLPEAVRAQLPSEESGAVVSFHWLIDDCSAMFGEDDARVMNLMNHAWRFPKAKEGSSSLKDLEMLAMTTVEDSGVSESGVKGISFNEKLKAETVNVHPGANGSMCCSPNNARMKVEKRDVSQVWTVTKHDSEDRYVVTCQWLLGEENVELRENINFSENLRELFQLLPGSGIRRDYIEEMAGIFQASID